MVSVSRVVNDCGPQMWTIPITKENSIQQNEEGKELNYAVSHYLYLHSYLSRIIMSSEKMEIN